MSNVVILARRQRARGSSSAFAATTVAAAFVAMTALPGASPAFAAETHFRCTAADGKVTLQDFPCAGGRGEARTIEPNRIGSGNPRRDAAAVAGADWRVSRDIAWRQYRDADERARSARRAADSSGLAQRIEEQRIIKAQERCRFHDSISQYCRDLDAMRQSDVDLRFALLRDQHEQRYRDALRDRAKAAAELARLGIQVAP